MRFKKYVFNDIIIYIEWAQDDQYMIYDVIYNMIFIFKLNVVTSVAGRIIAIYSIICF